MPTQDVQYGPTFPTIGHHQVINSRQYKYIKKKSQAWRTIHVAAVHPSLRLCFLVLDGHYLED